jgi:hypothetical protein
MKLKLYPQWPPQFREPIDRLFSPAELDAAREEFEDRACESRLDYGERWSTQGADALASALTLLGPEEERFFGARQDLQRALSRLV